MGKQFKCIGVDTTFLVDLLRGEERARIKAEELSTQRIILATTTINAFELFYGALISKRKAKNYEITKEFLERFLILNMDIKSSLLSAQIMSQLMRKGKILEIRDVFIAAILLSNHCEVIVTNNSKHFSRVQGLRIETY